MSATGQAAVDRSGLRTPLGVDEVQDVLFDGRRVWSFNPARDGQPEGAGRRTPWPATLLGFLDGRVHVTVRGHHSGQAVLDADVQYGESTRRVDVCDADGRPLTVDKAGRLQRMFAERDATHTRTLLDAVEQVLHTLTECGGVPAFLTFGCLLGAVRDGQMIGHDSDVDVSYLSRHTHPLDVILESLALERLLRGLGWQTHRMSSADFKVLVPMPDGGRVGLDVFTAFYVDDYLYVLPNVRRRVPSTALLPVSSVQLEGRSLPAPADPGALLEATYGASWRVPDPAFRFRTPTSTRRRFAGWMRGERRHIAYWNAFYAGAGGDALPTEPSAFARWVAAREDPATPLVDVGCGNGRDAVWFAGRGFDVQGFDYSRSAIVLAEELAARAGATVPFTFLNLYDMRHLLAHGALLAGAGSPRVVYARFLVHALDDAGRRSLWLFSRMALRGGGRLYLEYRVGAPAYVFGEHFCNAVATDVLVAEIEERGGVVEYRHEGHGLATIPGEDPLVGRLIVRWR